MFDPSGDCVIATIRTKMLNSKQLNRLVCGEVNNVREAPIIIPTCSWLTLIVKSVDSKSKWLPPCSLQKW